MKFLIYNVSQYQKMVTDVSTRRDDIIRYGWKKESINNLINDIRPLCRGYHDVLICWDSIFEIENKPFGIIQNVKPVFGIKGWENIFNGWTLTGAVMDEQISASSPYFQVVHLEPFMWDDTRLEYSFENIARQSTFFSPWVIHSLETK